MLLFYPLDYISFFSSPFAPILHRVSPSMSHRAQLWSVRAWGVYVGLQIISLLGEWKEYEARGSKEDGDADCVTVKKRKQAVMCQLVANVSRSPVILHWCAFSMGLSYTCSR
jgi:hypothetical protein